MAFFSRFLRQTASQGIKKEVLQADRGRNAFLAALAVAALFLLLFIFDGFVFYTTVTREPAPLAPATEKPALTSGRDIDEVIRLLDGRAKKFNEILNTK